MLIVRAHDTSLGPLHQDRGANVNGFGQPVQRNPKQLVFHPQTAEEYNIPPTHAAHVASQFGVRPKHRDYLCGVCGSNTNGRLLCDVQRLDGTTARWCLCGCDRREPTIIIDGVNGEMTQLPAPKKFSASADWPPDIVQLYEEASKSFGAGAFTSASMVCRKILMVCACLKEQDANPGSQPNEGQSFKYYVDYIANNILTNVDAKPPIAAIRDIGNDANHKVTFVNQADAERAMKIVQLMLSYIYSFPKA